MDLQRLVVDDHIRRLTDEDSARRAERDLARRRTPSAVPDDLLSDVEGHGFQASPVPLPRPTAPAPSTRVRFGRWLMGLGTTIAGPDAAGAGAVRHTSTGAAKPHGDDSNAMPRAV